MLKKIIINLFIIFILFENILKLPSSFNYWDEIVEIFIIFCGIGKMCKTKKMNKNAYMVILFMVSMCAIGIIGNVKYEYVKSWNFIIRDLVGFIKFPLTLVFLIYIRADEVLKKNLSKYTIIFIKVMVIIMALFGAISLFKDIGMSQKEIRYGIHPYLFIFTHPTYLVVTCFMILMIIEYAEKNEKEKLIYGSLISFLIIISMRTKGIVTLALYFYIKYFNKLIKKYKIISIVCIILITLRTAWSKIMLYNSYATSPREILYKGSITLLKKCFPIGSGFATFASHISYRANSKVYDFISMTHVIKFESIAVFGDAGYAYYIGQFGILGCILFVLTIVYLYKIMEVNKETSLSTKICFVYIIIALTSEATLITLGVQLAIIMALTRIDNTNLKIYKEEKDEA